MSHGALFCLLIFAVVSAVAKEDAEEIVIRFQGRSARSVVSALIEFLIATALVSASVTVISARLSAVSVSVTALSVSAVVRRIPSIVSCLNRGRAFVFQVIGDNDDIAVGFFPFACRLYPFVIGQRRAYNRPCPCSLPRLQAFG